ncbi:KAP family P-loop NTPase fold protein [Herbaspirillum seropedicae]|uniref:KAP family P-loop NTPase fold protein n=1 Tax=Herbaspirillum seropedicae TaxID=964 RepID=UPI003F8D5B58
MTSNSTDNTHSNSDFWQEDLLGRKDVANYLSNYLQRRYQLKPDEEGFVLALNAEWGFGKTFLMQAWAKELQYQKFPAVYFDAWKNDFTPEPLIAFIASMHEELSEAFKEIPAKESLEDAIKSLGKFVKPAIKGASLIALKRLFNIGFEELEGLVKGESTDFEYSDSEKSEDKKELVKKLGETLKDSLNEHKSKAQAIVAFRKKLSQLIDALKAESKFQLPVFFFVDELDRCRPNYAIELLEGIKHLFGVPGIYFVIGINTVQLGESTKAIYGPGFNGHRYLKRFFDQEYLLPEPNHEHFTAALFSNSSIPEISEKEWLTGLSQALYPGHGLPKLFELFAKAFGIGLRDRRRVMRIIEPALTAITEKTIHPCFLFFLAFLYERDSTKFEDLLAKKIDIDVVARSYIDEKVRIRYRTPSSDFSRNGGSLADVGIKEIAAIYLDHYEKSLAEIRKAFPGIVEFPYTLIERVTEEHLQPEMDSRSSKSSIASYPSLIRHSGQFA